LVRLLPDFGQESRRSTRCISVTVILTAHEREDHHSRLHYFPYKGLGLAGITAKSTPGLLRFQSKIIEALKPFIVVGTDADFVQNTDGTPIATGSSGYVNGFIQDHSGAKYNPHVTIGFAHEDFLKALIAAPYHAFIFTCSAASIYKLGDFGTARTKLWTTQ